MSIFGSLAVAAMTLELSGSAWGVQTAIHIHGTAPENAVNVRPQPNTSQPPIGTIPEGASPDYNCFAYGEVIGGVPVWFSVNYNGVTGYYASYYDDSSYRSDAELSSKYGVPKCGVAAPVATPAPAPTPTPSPTATPAAPPQVPSEATQSLPPDPGIWCVDTAAPRRYSGQVREGGVKYYFEGLSGTAGQNNWQCRFQLTRNGRTQFLKEYINIDFAEACQQQFPGSKLHYNTQAGPWPWECLGVAGKYYPPPSIKLRSLSRNGGYTASNIRSRTAGRLGLRLSAFAGTGRGRHAVTLGRGARSVTSAGAYKVRVRLTRHGRARMRHTRHLRVTFTLRVRPTSGKAHVSSTTVRMHR